MEWGQTACLMALIANLFRDSKKTKGVKPQDFNPYYQKPKPVIRVNMKQLKEMIPDPERMVTNGGSKR